MDDPEHWYHVQQEESRMDDPEHWYYDLEHCGDVNMQVFCAECADSGCSKDNRDGDRMPIIRCRADGSDRAVTIFV